MSKIRIATCVPRHTTTRADKIIWLERALDANQCELFLLPQEYLGGLVGMPQDRHIERTWVLNTFGELAARKQVALGVGAATKQETGGATEDYHYFDRDGLYCGYHRKFALPRYDDVRTSGGGRLWPETSFVNRATPIEIPSLGLRVGTVFCWEVFSLSLWAAYAYQRVGLIAHPIKFAPRGWLKLAAPQDSGTGECEVLGFDQAAKSTVWEDRLFAASREVLCPVAISCNTWAIGAKFKALVGYIDGVRGTSELHQVQSTADAEKVVVFRIDPVLYQDGMDALGSAGHFCSVVGAIDGFSELKEHTMAVKMRRLEAQLIGGTTALACKMRAATVRDQRKR